MKKTLFTFSLLAFVLCFASAEINFSFYNKLYEDSAISQHWDNYPGTDDSKTKSDFPGIINRMYFEVFSDRVDAMIKADVKLDDDDDSPLETEHYYLSGRIKDWYLEFRPIEPVTLSLHTGIFSDGSYLPVYDNNINAGNIGSDGFTVTVRPIKDLRIALTTPFGMKSNNWSNTYGEANFLNGEEEKFENKNFDVGLGTIYGSELFQVGFSIQDIADNDERQIGAYISLPSLFGVSDALTVGAGFAHSESFRTVVGDGDTISVGHIEGDVVYKNLFSAYGTMDFKKASLSAEIAYNLNDDSTEARYDLYTAASLSFGLTEKMTASVTGKLLADLGYKSGEKNENGLFGGFALNYDVNARHSVGAEFNIAICDKDWAIALPLYWKYHFDK